MCATSASLPGGPEPRRIDDVPPELLQRVGAVVDAGELPGTPSTVIDFTAAEPRGIREGAAPAAAQRRARGPCPRRARAGRARTCVSTQRPGIAAPPRRACAAETTTLV